MKCPATTEEKLSSDFTNDINKIATNYVKWIPPTIYGTDLFYAFNQSGLS